MTGPDFIWEHFQQDMETELQKWKDFPGFYGSWPPTGPVSYTHLDVYKRQARDSQVKSQ